jgi:hypothetical protein
MTALAMPDTDLTAGLATGLDPIGLEELVERASLLARVDRKYVVPAASLPALLAAAPRSTRVLEIDGRRSFGYRSAYLDTPERDSYLHAGRRHRRRFKVRTRAYLDTGTCWLEVKTRRGRDLTVKERIEHHDVELAPLTAEGLRFVDACLADAGLAPRAERLEPVLATAYSRATLFLPESLSRVTVDTDLGWTSLSGPRHRDLDRPALAVVETKTGSTPSAFDRLLWSHGHRPVQISKYGVGMAALHPELPRLKWHRTLLTHLDSPRRSS